MFSYSLRNDRVLLILLVSISILTMLLNDLFGTIITALIFAIMVLFRSFLFLTISRYNVLILLNFLFLLPLFVKVFMLYEVHLG